MAGFMTHIHRTHPATLPATRCILCPRETDLIPVWHGQPTPATACGFHARYYPGVVAATHNALLRGDHP